MAEFLIRREAERHGIPIRVSSAGTHAEHGHPIHPYARRSLEAMQIEPDDFRSRPVTERLVEQSSLVLTMTDAQRSWIVASFPRAVRRTYLLSQFSHLVGVTPVPDLLAPIDWGPSILARAIEGRLLAQPLIDGRDIEDPIGRQLRQFRNCARTIEQRVEPLFTGLSFATSK